MQNFAYYFTFFVELNNIIVEMFYLSTLSCECLGQTSDRPTSITIYSLNLCIYVMICVIHWVFYLILHFNAWHALVRSFSKKVFIKILPYLRGPVSPKSGTLWKHFPPKNVNFLTFLITYCIEFVVGLRKPGPREKRQYLTTVRCIWWVG